MTATDINYYVNGTNIIDINSSGINLMTGNIIMPSGGRITVSGDTYANGGIQFVGTNQITIRSPNTGAYHGFNIGSTGVTLEASSTNRMSFLGSTVTITNCNFSVNNSGSMVFGVNNIGNGQTLASGSNRSYMQFFNFTNANINLDITTGVLMGHVIKLIVPGNTLYSASITPISTATIRLVNGWVTTAGSSPVIATIGSSGAAGAQQSVATNTRLTLIKDRVYELVWCTTDSAWYMSMLSAPFG